VNPWMTPPPDLPSLDSPEKDALIVALIARIDALVAENTALRTRVAELEAKLGLPPKTPNTSSTPPSQRRKASDDAATKPALRPKLRGKPHAGAHRPLHPNLTARRDLMATACQHCGANVSSAPQIACEAYDHVEIPEIKPDITRVTLFGGTCPCCAKRFKAPPPQGLEPGSPFGPNLRAFVVYLRFTQGISFERLAKLWSDILGLDISEGALVNMLEAARHPFATQTSLIRARLLSGTANRTRPACGSANGTGGYGSSITRTAPSSSLIPRAPKAWFRLSSATSALISGSPTATSASSVGRKRKIRSASPISFVMCNMPSTRATASSLPSCVTCWAAPAASDDGENVSRTRP